MKKILGLIIGFLAIVVLLLQVMVEKAYNGAKENVRLGMLTPQKGEAKVGVPTFSGVKESMISYALGVGGGLLYGISTNILGSGLLGGLLGAGIAGAAIRGVRGEIISTVLGFQSIVGALAAGNGGSSTPTRGMV